MERQFICRIVGRGVPNDPYRAAVDGLPGVTHYKSAIRSNKEDGRPFLPWTVVTVEASDYAAIAALPDCIALPTAGLDTAITSIQRAAIRNKAATLGFTGLNIAANVTRRQLLRRLVKRHYPHADETEML